MAVVRKPGSKVVRVKSAPTVNTDTSTSVVAFIGETFRGEPYKPVRITSYAQFEEEFAKGYTDATKKEYLADAVKGFYENFTGEAYVVRVLGATPVKATAKVPASTGATYTAKEEGKWGNDVAIEVTQTSETFEMKISIQGKVVETFKGLTSDATVNSEYVTVQGTIAVGKGNLTGGTDGSELVVADYKKALNSLNNTAVNQIAIPGKTETNIVLALSEYCVTRGRVFPIYDAPLDATYEQAVEFRNSIPNFRGSVYHPWIQVTDPTTDKIKNVPPSGFLAGVYGRTDEERGVQKAPAGLDATIRGAVGVVTELSDTDVANLNANHVNCIIPKRGRGIVVWGARLVNTDDDRMFVSDLRVDDYIETSLEEGTEWVVFEEIDDQLFNRVTGQVKDFFNTLMRNKVIKGETPEEAYFVVCDRTNNPDRDASEVIIDVGYAKKKPAEFVTTRISQKKAE